MKEKKENKNSKDEVMKKNKKVFDFFGKHGKLVRCVIVVALLLAVVLFFALPLFNNGVKPSEEFKTANTILHKKVKGNLAENWYTQLHEKDIIPQNKIYVDYDYDTLYPTIVIGGEKISFEKNARNYNIVTTKDKDNAQVLEKVIKELFKISDANGEIKAIADSIGALPEYVDTVSKAKGVEGNNRILSLIYNTLVGDSKGHAAVCLNDNKMQIIRSSDLDLCAINVQRFYTVMKNIQDEKANTAGKNVMQILIEEGVLDTNAQLNIAYYDVRHDCVRGAHETICKIQSDKDKFQILAKQLKENPTTTFIYDEDKDSLVILDDVFLCNESTMFVKIDSDALNSAMIVKSKTKVYDVLLLLIGLALGLVAYPLFRKTTKRDSADTQSQLVSNGTDVAEGEEAKPLTLEAVIKNFKESDEFKDIKSKADQYNTMKESAKKLKEQAETFKDKSEKYQKDAEKYKKIADKYKELLDCRNEADLIATLQLHGMAKIHSFQQMADKKCSLDDVVKIYDGQTKQNLTKELQELEKKAQWYDSNYDIVVAPINSFHKTIHGEQRRDRAFFFESAMRVLALPILGDGYKNVIKNALDEDKEMMHKAKAYQLLIDTKEDFTTEAMIASLSKEVGADNAKWLATVREAARRYSSIKSFSDTMWEKFVKEFVSKEPSIEDSSSMEDKGWYFEMLMNIAYHTADHIRSIKDSGNAIFCYNKALMDSGFNMKTANEFYYNNINKSTNHTNTIYQWATGLGVKKLKIVVDNYAIMQ